jgi:hypothetical protein
MLAKKQQVYYSCKIIRSQLSPFLQLSPCAINLNECIHVESDVSVIH